MHQLAQSVLFHIRKHDLLQAGDRVGVAVSGGADSVALLRLMFELRQEIGLVVSVVHLNHKLRGTESDADEAFVRELAEKHGLELISESRDVSAYAAQKKAGIEASARELRYELFETLLRSEALGKIATAHTLDDQAETLLLKLARGAGTRGLAGIWPKVAISHQPSADSKPEMGHPNGQTIVRPLLVTRREELRTYLSEIGQTWREDSSNRDLRRARNRIRHGILPRLERHMNPHVCETFAETAEIARAEEEYWAREVARLLGQVWDSGEVTYTRLGAFPLALRRRLLRAGAESLGLTLEFQHVEEILSLKAEGSASLAHGWIATRHNDAISFHRTEEFSDYEYPLSVPGSVAVPEARVNVEVVVVKDVAQSQDVLDSSFARRELVVRNWRAGERFLADHSKGPKKIKELLQDRHIKGDEKSRWPVIAGGDEVVWMRGFGVRRDFRSRGGGGVLIKDTPIKIV